MDVQIYFEVFGNKKSIIIKDVYNEVEAEEILRNKIHIHEIKILSGSEESGSEQDYSGKDFGDFLRNFLGLK